MLTECGGYGYPFMDEHNKNWLKGFGYGNHMKDADELVEKYTKMVKSFQERPWLQGFVYTELYDQYWELNGLLTFDRKPKLDPVRIKAIHDSLKPQKS